MSRIEIFHFGKNLARKIFHNSIELCERCVSNGFQYIFCVVHLCLVSGKDTNYLSPKKAVNFINLVKEIPFDTNPKSKIPIRISRCVITTKTSQLGIKMLNIGIKLSGFYFGI